MEGRFWAPARRSGTLRKSCKLSKIANTPKCSSLEVSGLIRESEFSLKRWESGIWASSWSAVQLQLTTMCHFWTTHLVLPQLCKTQLLLLMRQMLRQKLPNLALVLWGCQEEGAGFCLCFRLWLPETSIFVWSQKFRSKSTASMAFTSQLLRDPKPKVTVLLWLPREPIWALLRKIWPLCEPNNLELKSRRTHLKRQ